MTKILSSVTKYIVRDRKTKNSTGEIKTPTNPERTETMKTKTNKTSIIETITTALTDLRAQRDDLNKQISELEGMLSHYESELHRVIASLKGTKKAKRTVKRGPGRPKGSKNKAKTSTRRGPGRPKGSKNKAKTAKTEKTVEKKSAAPLKAVIVSMLREYGEPVHVNELQHRLETEGVTDNAKTVAVTLSALKKKGEVKKGDEVGFWAVA